MAINDKEMHEWLDANDYAHKGESLEGWMIDWGFVRGSSDKITDIETKQDDTERRLDVAEGRLKQYYQIICFLIQGRIEGYEVNGNDMRLTIDPNWSEEQYNNMPEVVRNTPRSSADLSKKKPLRAV